MSIRKYCPTEPCGEKIRYVGHEAADDQGNGLQESGAAQRQDGCRVREGEWHNGERLADIARRLQVFQLGGRLGGAPSWGAVWPPILGVLLHPQRIPIALP